MPGKSYKYQKLVKDASNIAIFYGSHIDGIVCEEQIDLRVGKDIKEILKFYKNELRL